ncbi:MAG: hypothetical protein ACW9XH_01820 [Candidatus Nitrosopumilus sp. bin_32a]
MKQYILIAIIVGVFAVGIMTGAFGGHLAHVNHMERMMSGGMSGMSGMGGMSGMSGMGGMSGMSGMGGMSGMSGMGGMSGMSGMGGMSGMSGMSRHGNFFVPGSIHQLCHQDSTMSPAYCEPYYHVMSSIPGVRITNIDPIDNTTLEVTLTEISSAKNGIHQDVTLFVGNDFLFGSVNVPGGWNGKTTVSVPLSGMGIVYDFESMHAHLLASSDSSMNQMGHQ